MNSHPLPGRLAAPLAGLFLLLVPCGCMVGPAYHRPSAPAPPVYKENLPAGWKEAQPGDGALRGEWWSLYNDPQLSALASQVEISNQNVLAFEARFREAREAARVARASLYPTLTAAPSASRSGPGISGGMQHTYALSLDASYQADVWGGIRRAVRANTAIAQATAAQLENAKLLYQAELVADYFQLQGLDATRLLLESTVQSFEQSLRITEDRFEGGVASKADIALAQTQLEGARAELTDLGVGRAQLEHAIAVLTGKPPVELSIAPLTAPRPPPAWNLAAPSALLERRPDVAAAERQMAAANEEIGIAKAALFPALDITASGGTETELLSDLLTWPARFWSLGARAAQPIFYGGRLRAQVRLSEAAYDESVANYRQTVLSAVQEVEDSLAGLRILEREADENARAVKAARESLDIANIQYLGGMTNFLQVIIAQTSLLQNQRSAVNVLTRRQLASVALIQALGGGWDAARLPTASELRH